MATRQNIAFILILAFIMLSGTRASGTTNWLISANTDENTAPISNIEYPDAVNKIAEEETDMEVNRTKLDLDALFDYLDQLYNPTSGKVQTRINGYTTSIAVFQYLSVLKLTGIEKYMIGSESLNEIIFSSNLDILKDGPGYKINDDAEQASIAGSYGVITSLELMDEVEKLNIIAENGSIIEWLNTQRFTNITAQTGYFKDPGFPADFETTYMALKIYDILDFEIPDTIKDNVSNWIISTWDTDHFVEPFTEESAIVSNWFAVNSLRLLNKSSDIVYPELNGYEDELTAWLDSFRSSDDGGYTISNNSTVTETGAALALIHTLGTFNSSTVDLNQTLQFIIDTQYLSVDSSRNYGGFSPNPSTHNNSEGRQQVSLKNTFYSCIGLFTAGYLLNQTDIQFTIETKYSRDNGNTDAKNEVLQGVGTNLYLEIAGLEYKSFTGLDVELSHPSLNITRNLNDDQVINTETGLYEYGFILYNDSWELGPKSLSGTYALRNFTLFPVSVNTFNVNLTVNYGLDLTINKSGSFVPGEGFNLKILAYNGSTDNGNYQNITTGTLNLTWMMPNKTRKLISSDDVVFPNNITEYNLSIPVQADLGIWSLQIAHLNVSQSITYSSFNVSFEVNTGIELTEISGDLEVDPGDNYQIEIVFKYDNGTFPAIINATCFIENNKTSDIVFNTTVEPVAIGAGRFRLNTSDIIPNKLWAGYYNLSFVLSWNVSYSENYISNHVSNSTLRQLQLFGDAVVWNQTDFPSIVNPGQYISFLTNISILTSTDTILDVDGDVQLKAEILNSTDHISQRIFPEVQDEGIKYNFSFTLNPNLESGNYRFKIQILHEVNNTYIDVLSGINRSSCVFNFTLQGVLTLDEVSFLTEHVKMDDLYHINLTELSTSAIVNFKVKSGNPMYAVSGLSLHANITGNEGEERLPKIAASLDSDIYQLIIPLSGRSDGNYTITIFTEIALAENTVVGSIQISVKTISVEEFIPVELMIAYVVAGLAIVVTALNIFVRNRKGK
ncbi:MAG: prenyltransferase/squalene oxidase repeat-containing protein [Candidatus Hodarchaeales archaeon]